MSIWSLKEDQLTLKRLIESKHHHNNTINSCSFLDNNLNSVVISGGTNKKLILSDIKEKKDHVMSQPNKGFIRKIKTNDNMIAVAFDYG